MISGHGDEAPLPALAKPPEDQGPFGYENRLVAIFALAGGVSGLDALAVYFLMPFLARDLGLNNTEIGTLSLAVSIGWALSSLLIGYLSDRMGRRKPFLITAFLLFSVFSGLSAIATTFTMLLMARLLMGLVEGPVIPVQQAIIMRESSPHRRGLNMGIVQNLGSQGIGSLLGPLITVQLALSFGWRAAFLIAGVPGLIMAWVIARYVREPARPSIDAAVNETAGGGRFLALLAYRNMRLCAIVGAAAAAWFYILLTFLPLWLVNVAHVSPSAMSVVVSAVGVGGVIWSLVIPWLSDRFGRRRIMVVAAACGAIPPLAALLLGSHLILISLLTFGGCTVIALFPLCTTVPLETVPQQDAATATAIIVALSTIMGGGLGPLAGGMLADSFGLAAPLYGALVLTAIAAFACCLLEETVPAMGLEGQS